VRRAAWMKDQGLRTTRESSMAKLWAAEVGMRACDAAIQIHGGYGYTREYPVEQFYRDNRLNMIHEGTHAIQSIDLLGRKVVMQQGAALELLGREIAATAKDASAYETLSANADALSIAWSNVVQTVKALAPLLKEQGELALANSIVFLEAFGHTVVAWQWLRQGLVATRALEDVASAAKGDAEVNFYRGKLHTCAWFFDWELPRCRPQHELLRSLNDSTLKMQDSWF
ncbi:MAG TPA: acyl-CoA dehydrogenase, partial [Rhizobacter sp.]|nr:acyl-CoA dehydrogenase [Rhizobacter sp.]